jgi:beta-glucanase (GH16 family)
LMALVVLPVGVALALGSTFTENWTGSTSSVFAFLQQGGSTITSNVADAAASDGKIVQLVLPAFPGAGPNAAPNLQSTDVFTYGTYEARLKTADCTSQPSSGVITGFFNYLNDGTDQDGNGVTDNIEIDFEWLCAEPQVMWMTMWTDFRESPLAMKRVYRELDLSTGQIRRTCYSEGYGTCTQDLTGSGSEGGPSSITPISGYNSAANYYTYGFTWLSNRVTWYIMHPTTGAKIILWDYQGPTARIAHRPARYMFNVWHTNNWPPPSMPGAIQQPNSARTMKIDWVKYTAAGAQPTITPGGPTITPTSASNCYPAWISNITYPTGTRVTYNGVNYQANYPTNGDNPALHSGPAGSGQPWLTLGNCTGGNPPTATRTNTPVGPTATRTRTPVGPTATRTRTPTPSANPNRALNRPVTASSVEAAGLEAARAVDGNGATRWASIYSDPQWITVDLGATYSINRVRLNWEAAYGRSYQIQVSGSASGPWTTIYSTTTGNGAVDDLTGLSGSGRYVRMNGTARGTAWGYSLWDFEVYGN